MEIILTHSNADFDAFASMVAAKKLYPSAKLVCLGSEEFKVREFINRHRDLLGIVDKDQIDVSHVRKIILVDTSIASRLGKFSQIAASGNVPVFIYDHHPETDHDLPGRISIRHDYGATVTILVSILKEKGIFISSFEATLLTLGIYEDTNMLTAVSTKKEDIEAVSYLFSFGADLPSVSHYLNQELDNKQVKLLTRLLEGLESYWINGIPIFIATASSEEHVRDVSLVVHKLRDVENAKVLFAIVTMENRIHIIARSNLAYIDVSGILSAFGGGGHPTAASVTLKNKTLIQVREDLIKKLRYIKKPSLISEIMQRDFECIGPYVKVQNALKLLERLRFDRIPVVGKGKFLGMLFIDDVNRALNMNLLHENVRSLLRTDTITIHKGELIDTVKHLLFEQDTVLPVIEEDSIIGIVSQADVLKYFHEDFISGLDESRSMPVDRKGMHVYDAKSMMKVVVPKELYKLLEEIGQMAAQMKCQAFIVGGYVRDILLGEPSYDIDVVIEEIGVAFAQQFAKKKKGRCVVYEKFATAVVVLPSGLKVDFATARKEIYSEPGALPQVELSSIRHDLYRRDFTINAMAIQLNENRFGRLIDFFGGQRDMKDGVVRVLHNLSFIEDPTRIFRAVRFEQRLGFSIDRHTQMLIKKAVGMDIFEKVSYGRIRDEIVLMLSEPEPIKAITRMAEFNELRFIHPAIKLNRKHKRIFERIERYLAWYRIAFPNEKTVSWLVYFIALLDNLTISQIQEVCDRFMLRKKHTYEIIQGERFLRLKEASLNRVKEMRPSEVTVFLERFQIEIILFLMARFTDEESIEQIIRYLKKYRFIKPSISGKTLQKMGVKQGPRYSEIFEKIRLQKIDGKITTRQEEIAKITAILKK